MIIPFYSFIYEFMFHHASELFFNLGCLGCTFEGYFLNILLGSRKKKNGSAARVRSSSWLHWPAGDLFSVVVCTFFVWGRPIQKCHFTRANDDHQGFKLDPLKHWNTTWNVLKPSSFRRMSASPMDLDVVRTLSWWPVSPTSPGISRNLQDMLLCW